MSQGRKEGKKNILKRFFSRGKKSDAVLSGLRAKEDLTYDEESEELKKNGKGKKCKVDAATVKTNSQEDHISRHRYNFD